MGAREVSWGYRESCVDAALTRASRRLQKKTATAAPLALSLTEAVDIRGISHSCGSYQRCDGKMIQPIATSWRRLAERIESVKSRANPAPTATLRRL